jgi:hypothetical protein
LTEKPVRARAQADADHADDVFESTPFKATPFRRLAAAAQAIPLTPHRPPVLPLTALTAGRAPPRRWRPL